VNEVICGPGVTWWGALRAGGSMGKDQKETKIAKIEKGRLRFLCLLL
jgi:hypothetical protein